MEVRKDRFLGTHLTRLLSRNCRVSNRDYACDSIVGWSTMRMSFPSSHSFDCSEDDDDDDEDSLQMSSDIQGKSGGANSEDSKGDDGNDQSTDISVSDVLLLEWEHCRRMRRRECHQQEALPIGAGET
ncbi:hypothetical protein MHU86_15598 [Fragilaria crotonensis]|nr:hypothetical protein MHU86_15598 [Fragilaria crotonensis]